MPPKLISLLSSSQLEVMTGDCPPDSPTSEASSKKAPSVRVVRIEEVEDDGALDPLYEMESALNVVKVINELFYQSYQSSEVYTVQSAATAKRVVRRCKELNRLLEMKGEVEKEVKRLMAEGGDQASLNETYRQYGWLAPLKVLDLAQVESGSILTYGEALTWQQLSSKHILHGS